jgi:hypothetical protein
LSFSPPFCGVERPDRTQKRGKKKIRKNNNNNRGTSEAKTRGEAHIPFTTMLVCYVTSYNKQARSLCAHQERAAAKLSAKSENGKAQSLAPAEEKPRTFCQYAEWQW